MRFNLIVLSSLLLLSLVGCTRAAKDNKASVSIELPNSAAGSSSLKLAHVAINVTAAGMTPIVFTKDFCNDCSTPETVPDSFDIIDISSGPDRLFQVLAVYKNIETSQMIFYYGDVTKTLEGGIVPLEVPISQVGSGNVTSGRVSGRYLETATTGPTGMVDVKYNPGNGKQPIVVDTASIVNGWFSFFMLSGASLQYVPRGSTAMLWGQEMSLESAAMNPAENSGAYFDQRVRAFLPVHIRTQYQNNVQVYLPAESETFVWGYWGPGATGKKVCTSGLDSSPSSTKLKRFATANLSSSPAFTISHVSNYNEPVPTKAELTDKASPYTTIVVQGGADMSSSCGSFADNATNQYANFQKVYLELFDGNGGDNAAGFRGIFRSTITNGSSSFVTVSSGDPRVLTGQILPGVVDVFNKLRLFKRPGSEDFYMDSPNCSELASKGFVPGSSTDGTIDSSGNFSLTSTISSTEASAGVSAVICPMDPAGNVAQMGTFISKWNFNSGGGGGGSVGGPATKIIAMKMSSPLNLAPTYQCFDIMVQLQDANGMSATPPTSPTNFTIATTNPSSGVNYYSSYADCMAYTNALDPNALTIPANQNSRQIYMKSNTSGSSFTLTPSSGSLTQGVLALALESSSSFIRLDLPQSMLPALCYKGKAVNSYISGSSSPVGANTTVTLTGSSGLTFYSDAACSTTTTSVVINSGNSDADIYVKISGSTGSSMASTSASGASNADFRFYQGSGSATVAKLSITGANTASTGGCTGPYDVTLQNSTSTTVPASSSLSANLAGNLAPTFYSDNACTSSTSTVGFTSGEYRKQVWIKYLQAGPVILNASNGSLTAGTYPVTVNGLQRFDLAVEGAATSVNHGTCVRLEVLPTNYPSGAGSFPFEAITLNFVNFPSGSLYKNRINGECVASLGTSISLPSYAPSPLYVYMLVANTAASSSNLAGQNMHIESSNYTNGMALALSVGAPPALAATEASGEAATEFPFSIIDIIDRFTGVPSYITSYFNGSSWTTAPTVSLTNSTTTSTKVQDSNSASVTYSVTGRQSSWIADFTTGTMPSNFSLTRSSQAYEVLATGYLSLVASHVPRWDRNPTPGSGYPIRGLMVEGATTNLLGSGNISEDFSLWDINPGGNGYAQVSRSNSISGADLFGGSTPLWQLSDTNAGNGANVERAVVVFTNDIADNQEFVASVYMKKDTSRYAGLMLQSNGGMSAGVVVDLDTGNTMPMTGPYTPQEVLASGAIKHNDGWYRVWVKFNSHVGTHGMLYLFPAFCDTNATSICQNGEITAMGTMFAWGAQVEQSSDLTSYVPTSIGTRVAEDLSIGLSYVTSFSQSVGTFRAEFARTGSTLGKTLLYLGNSTDNMEVYGDGTDGKIQARVTAGSVDQGLAIGPLPFAPNGNPNVTSFSYASGSNVKVNVGVNGLAGSSGNIPTASAASVSGTSLRIGSNPSNSTSYVNGSIKKVHYWPNSFGIPGIRSNSK